MSQLVRIGWARATLLAALLAAFGSPAARAHAFFIEEIVSFAPGSGAGFGQDRMPDVVLGPPRGAGEFEGSFDVLALGDGGEIVVRLGGGGACDRPGPDFTIFENAFRIAGAGSAIFIEVGIVAASSDGAEFVTFPYDPETFAGLAGRTPVLSHPDNGIDPRDPSVSGGDAFDLADIGLERALYVRITDPGAAIPDPGNRVPPGNSAGFDLDAIAVVHACDEPGATPTATASATPSPATDATETPTFPPPTPSPPPETETPIVQTPTPTPPPAMQTPMMTPSPEPTGKPTGTPPLIGDADGDGFVTPADVDHTILEMFDGDGDRAADAAGGRVYSAAGVDANGDGVVTAADLTAILRLLGRP